MSDARRANAAKARQAKLDKLKKKKDEKAKLDKAKDEAYELVQEVEKMETNDKQGDDDEYTYSYDYSTDEDPQPSPQPPPQPPLSERKKKTNTKSSSKREIAELKAQVEMMKSQMIKPKRKRANKTIVNIVNDKSDNNLTKKNETTSDKPVVTMKERYPWMYA